MKKIVILYHSGVNNTKIISNKIYEHISKNMDVEIFSIEKLPSDFNINKYDGVIIGFPVIHASPSKRIMEFIDNIDKASKNKPAYIFTTCGLYSGNALREFSKKCVNKNIMPVLTRDLNNCPAVDGILLAPFIKSFSTFPKDFEEKLVLDLIRFQRMLKREESNLKIPRFKLYTILNYPNKILGHLVTFDIYLHKENCIKCNKCSNNCPTNVINIDSDGYPNFNMKKCEKCYRCIHHCPKGALSLSKKKTPRKLLGINKSGII